MRDHTERSPSALAHGAAKSDDIERVRRDVDNAEGCVARDDRLPPHAAGGDAAAARRSAAAPTPGRKPRR